MGWLRDRGRARLERADITAQEVTVGLGGGDAVFHVAVPARHWWDDIGHS